MIAMLFPGQGSQCVGMGRALAEHFPIVRARLEEADRFFSYTGQSLLHVMHEGPESELMQTCWAQPALFALSAALFDVVQLHCHAYDISIGAVAGHSLGEYSALYAAGCFSFQEGLAHIQARFRAMTQVQDGAMAAILKLNLEQVQDLIQQYGASQVEIANDNCPGQIVISGKKDALPEVLSQAQTLGARCIPLKVSGPFHTSLMAPAAEVFSQYLASCTCAAPLIPIITNVNAAPVKDPDLIKAQLIEQIKHPVRWRETIEHLHLMGITTYLEIGPGTVLAGLVRKTLPSAQILSLGEVTALEEWKHSTLPHHSCASAA